MKRFIDYIKESLLDDENKIINDKVHIKKNDFIDFAGYVSNLEAETKIFNDMLDLMKDIGLKQQKVKDRYGLIKDNHFLFGRSSTDCIKFNGDNEWPSLCLYPNTRNGYVCFWKNKGWSQREDHKYPIDKDGHLSNENYFKLLTEIKKNLKK